MRGRERCCSSIPYTVDALIEIPLDLSKFHDLYAVQSVSSWMTGHPESDCNGTSGDLFASHFGGIPTARPNGSAHPGASLALIFIFEAKDNP
jgi:hypothetical protein